MSRRGVQLVLSDAWLHIGSGPAVHPTQACLPSALLVQVGNPCISKGLHYCDSSPLTTSGAEFGSTADLRANSQRHLPGGAATFRAHVTWLEWEE